MSEWFDVWRPTGSDQEATDVSTVTIIFRSGAPILGRPKRVIPILDIGSFVDQRSGDFRVFDRLGNLEKDDRLPNDVVFTRHNRFPDTPRHITRKSEIRSGGTV
jgi:hypothetical protein